MGFSDSLKRIQRDIQGATGGTKVFKEARRGINKIGFDGTTTRGVKGGGFNSNEIGSALFAGAMDKSALYNLTNFAEDPTSFKKGEAGLRGNVKGMARSAAVANLGQQSITAFQRESAEETPPTVGDGPGVGSEDIRARQLARQRAIAAARRRRGSTIATSPLGVQGPGAATGTKRLLGE